MLSNLVVIFFRSAITLLLLTSIFLGEISNLNALYYVVWYHQPPVKIRPITWHVDQRISLSCSKFYIVDPIC